MNTDNAGRNRILYLKGKRGRLLFKKKLISMRDGKNIMPFLGQNARKTRDKLFLEVKVIAKL